MARATCCVFVRRSVSHKNPTKADNVVMMAGSKEAPIFSMKKKHTHASLAKESENYHFTVFLAATGGGGGAGCHFPNFSVAALSSLNEWENGVP